MKQKELMAWFHRQDVSPEASYFGGQWNVIVNHPVRKGYRIQTHASEIIDAVRLAFDEFQRLASEPSGETTVGDKQTVSDMASYPVKDVEAMKARIRDLEGRNDKLRTIQARLAALEAREKRLCEDLAFLTDCFFPRIHHVQDHWEASVDSNGMTHTERGADLVEVLHLLRRRVGG